MGGRWLLGELFLFSSLFSHVLGVRRGRCAELNVCVQG